jgi:hypothetical protein
MLTVIVTACAISMVALLGILVGAKLAQHRCRACQAPDPDGLAELAAERPAVGLAHDHELDLERREAPPRRNPFPATVTIN